MTAADSRRTLALALLGALLLLGCRQDSKPPPEVPVSGGLAAITDADDLQTRMFRFAEQAVIDTWENHRTVLDYSPESVEIVEVILDNLAEVISARQFSDKDIRAEALILGAYLGEVIRREHGGTWAENHHVAGPGSHPLDWGQRESFPYIWCYKRLTLGEEENVWHKYEFFVHNRKVPGVEYEIIKHPEGEGDERDASLKSEVPGAFEEE